MAATVRMFSWKGLHHAFVADYSAQQAFHAMTMFSQPYLARETITATTGSAQATSAGLSPTNSRILQVQVQPGKRVHYEVTPNGQALREAVTDSPVIEGTESIQWGSGWRISLLEAS